jgi:HEAT repeat protein
MMKSKIILPVLLVLTLAIGLFYFKKRTPELEIKSTDKVVLESNNDKSALERFLNDEEISEGLVYAAVIRLGQDGEPLAFEVAKKLVNHKSKLLREGAAQALGYFSDAEVLPLFAQLIADQEESVRVFAVEGLSEASSPARIQEVEQRLRDQNLGSVERVAVRASLYRMRQVPKEKETELAALVGLTKKADPILVNKASIKAIQIAPKEKIVKDLMTDSVKWGKDVSVKALSIRMLANANDPWIKSKLSDLVQDKSSMVKIAAIQSVHRICPENRWSILSHVIKREGDEKVVGLALEEAGMLERTKANEIFTQLKATKELNQKRIQMISLAQIAMNKKPEVKICK